MFFTNERSPKKIVEIIESIEGTLLFNSELKLKKIMHSINFSLFAQHSNIREDHCNFIYGGELHGHTVYLNFLKNTNSDDIKLACKFFMKLNEDFVHGTRHRDNDLPARLCYENNGQYSSLDYFFENENTRKNSKPVFIAVSGDEASNIFYRYGKYEDYSGENLSLYSLKVLENKIIDAHFYYNNNLIDLTFMEELIPEIKNMKIIDLENLKKSEHMTQDIVNLLDMTFIN
jgi:hypothetical protein